MKKSSEPKLHGKKIFLRPPRPGDYREFTGLMKRSATEFRGLVQPMTGRQQFSDYLRCCKEDDFLGLLICRSEDAAIVGKVSLFHIIHQGLQSACLGYFVGAPHFRKGYATEAISLVVRLAFSELKLHRVEANIQPGNVPSIAVVKRLGFSKEGFSPRYIKIGGKWRDHERWALLIEDWRK